MTVKMLIAEDEQSFREGLASAIDWKLYDVEITGAAENGKEALEMMRSNPPQLLLTDIRMPFMGGLELIREAQAAGLQFQTILLTGFGEFDYAKQAIKLGVSDYLLKPCTPQDIVRIVLEVKRKIEAAGAEEQIISNMSRTWNRSIHMLKNQVLSTWMQQPLMPLEDRHAAMREYNLSLKPEPIEVGRIALDSSDNERGAHSSRDLELIRYAMLNIAEETLRPQYGGHVEVFRHGDELLWIGNRLNGGASGQHQTKAAEALQRNLESYLKVSASLALSSVHPSVNNANSAYEEASKALEERFYQGKGGIYLYSELHRPQSGKSPIADDLRLERIEKELLAQLHNGQYSGAVDSVEAAVAYLKADTGYSRTEIIWRVSSIIAELQKFAKERCSSHIEWQNDLIDWMEQVPEMETLDDCSVILGKIIQSIVGAVSDKKQLHRTVQATLELIKSKYHTNLTLELAAKETFVSNSYLSSLFKQELGVNFLDYLHQYRVERAKELLKENYKVFAVARQVGYQEERHFSSTFKKWTGMTPSQYQKSYLQESG